MKRVILASKDMIQEDTLQLLSEMSSTELRRNHDAVDICEQMEDMVRNAAISISKKYGWDDPGSYITKRNETDLYFQSSGLVYTNNKRLLERVCDKLEGFMKTTPFNEYVETSYYQDNGGYRIVVSGVKMFPTEDDWWWN